MSELADFISQQLKDRNWSLRVAEEHTGISRAVLSSLINNAKKPELETLVRISQAFDSPLWRIVEMAGYDLGFDPSSYSIADRIASLIDAAPTLRPGLQHLLTASPNDIMGMLAYLEGQSILRRQVQGVQDTQVEYMSKTSPDPEDD